MSAPTDQRWRTLKKQNTEGEKGQRQAAYTSGEPKADSAAAIVGCPSPWIETRSPRSIRIELNPYGILNSPQVTTMCVRAARVMREFQTCCEESTHMLTLLPYAPDHHEPVNSGSEE